VYHPPDRTTVIVDLSPPLLPPLQRLYMGWAAVATVAADDLVKAQSALTTRLHLTTVMMMDSG